MFKRAQKKAAAKQLIVESYNLLSSQDNENIACFFDNGEVTLALETMCVQLFEYEATVSEYFVEKLKDISDYYSLENKYIEMVNELVNR